MDREKDKLIKSIMIIYDDECIMYHGQQKYYTYDGEKIYDKLNLLTTEQLYFYYYYIDKKNLKQLSNDDHSVSIGETLPINEKGRNLYTKIPTDSYYEVKAYNPEDYSDSGKRYPYFGSFETYGDKSYSRTVFLPIHSDGYPYLKNYERRLASKKINAANIISRKTLANIYKPESRLVKKLEQNYTRNALLQKRSLTTSRKSDRARRNSDRPESTRRASTTTRRASSAGGYKKSKKTKKIMPTYNKI
jgi:hypothetical protein